MGEYYDSGTEGYATIGSPRNDPYVITVSATNNRGSGAQSAQTMTSYSFKGPTALDHIVKPELVASVNVVVSLMASRNTTLFTSYPGLALYACDTTCTNCGPAYGHPQQ